LGKTKNKERYYEEETWKWLPLKKEIVAGVTVLTLGSGISVFLREAPDCTDCKAGLLSIMATLSSLVNGILAITGKQNSSDRYQKGNPAS